MLQTATCEKPALDFETFLRALVGQKEAHARFLNTLSLLEYIGARKIIKSQDERDISLDVLTHASEELRHARVFKKLAQEVSQREFPGYSPEELFCKAEAKEYFKSVEAFVEAHFPEPGLCYRMTTLIVEERVLKLYPCYEAILAELGFPGRIHGILKEEEKHLKEIESWQQRQPYLSPEVIRDLNQKESAAFHRFLEALFIGLVPRPRDHRTDLRALLAGSFVEKARQVPNLGRFFAALPAKITSHISTSITRPRD